MKFEKLTFAGMAMIPPLIAVSVPVFVNEPFGLVVMVALAAVLWISP